MGTQQLRAAIYARKSTEQRGVPDEHKSVPRQKELATQFAASRGWRVVAEFADDGISGAEFERRPGSMSLLAALRPNPSSRADGREQKSSAARSPRPAIAIKRLSQAGVQVVEYVHGQTLMPKSWPDKMLSTV